MCRDGLSSLRQNLVRVETLAVTRSITFCRIAGLLYPVRILGTCVSSGRGKTPRAVDGESHRAEPALTENVKQRMEIKIANVDDGSHSYEMYELGFLVGCV